MIRNEYKMLIGDNLAENLKIDYGAMPLKQDKYIKIRGRICYSLPDIRNTVSKIYAALSANMRRDCKHNYIRA